MTQTLKKDIVIIGAGLGGLATAIACQRAGFDYAVFEKRNSFNEPGAGLSIWPNASSILEKLDLLEDVNSCGGHIRKLVFVTKDGKPIRKIDLGEFSQSSFCVTRRDLHAAFLKKIRRENIFTGEKYQRVESVNGHADIRFTNGRLVKAKLLIGADGFRSSLRADLHGDTKPIYRGYRVWWGITDAFTNPHGEGTGFGTLDSGKRFVFLTAKSRTFWYATANLSQGHTLPDRELKKMLLSFFADWDKNISQVIRLTEADSIIETHIYDRKPIRRWGRGPITLLGDAAHIMTPDMGQGTGLAVEDAYALVHCLKQNGLNARSLRNYENFRYRRTTDFVRSSMLFSRMCQLQNPLAVNVRNAVLRNIPEWIPNFMMGNVFSYRIN